MLKRFPCLMVLGLALLSLPVAAQSFSAPDGAGFERPLVYAGQFVRQSKQPATRTETFTLPQDSTGPYVLRVTNGHRDGGRRMRSVRILLNGTEIVAGGQVNGKTEFLWVPVSRQLREQNLLTVTVKGKSGAEIYITLEDLEAVARAFTPRSRASASAASAPGGLH